MNRQTLLASTAVALLMCSAPALAQMVQKGGEEKGSPAATSGQHTQQQGARVQEQESGKGTRAEQNGRTSEQRTQQRQQGARVQEQESGKGTRAEQNSRASRNAATQESGSRSRQRGAQMQPEEKGGASQSRERGAQMQQEQRGRQSPTQQKGAETQTQQKSGSPQNRAETPAQQRGAAGQSEQRGATAGRSGEMGRSAAEGGKRVQISEQQRTSVQQTLLREHDVNRVGHADFSITVGARVPRSVRLAVLPAAIASQVPQWRSYRYFVSNDEICIIDPGSYEIVDVISGPNQAAGLNRGAVHAGLSLTPEERAIVMRSVSLNGGSTLGLGALSEGATVPRDVQIRAFPERVQREVPKLHGYKYFTAENRVAIVDPRDEKVALVISR